MTNPNILWSGLDQLYMMARCFMKVFSCDSVDQISSLLRRASTFYTEETIEKNINYLTFLLS
ncbi:hypothetical protein ABNJ30_20275, partial [Acinetobacter baumannii]